MCAQIPDVAAVTVAATTATTVPFESPDSRSSTPDELTPALAQHGNNRPDDGGGGRTDECAIDCTMIATAGGGTTNRSTSFGKYTIIV